jgi:hypothetical protein
LQNKKKHKLNFFELNLFKNKIIIIMQVFP